MDLVICFGGLQGNVPGNSCPIFTYFEANWSPSMIAFWPTKVSIHFQIIACFSWPFPSTECGLFEFETNDCWSLLDSRQYLMPFWLQSFCCHYLISMFDWLLDSDLERRLIHLVACLRLAGWSTGNASHYLRLFWRYQQPGFGVFQLAQEPLNCG